MSGLSTHVLDQTIGKPGVGVSVDVYRDGVLERTLKTDADGRCVNLHGEGDLKTGRYRLVFAIGDYFSRASASGAVPFFENATIEFVIADGMTRCHVPLLASPFAYSTYRGS